MYPETAYDSGIFTRNPAHCFQRAWAKCPSLKSWSDWMDMKKRNRPVWEKITVWDFLGLKQWGSCFPINRWLLLFLPRQLDSRHYLLSECLIKFWLCEAWVIRGKKCHPWDCRGLFPCTAATVSELKGSPIVHSGPRSSDYARSEGKKMGLLLCGGLKFHYSQLNLKQPWFLKSRIIVEYLWRERRRIKWAQSFSELWGGVKKKENVAFSNIGT